MEQELRKLHRETLETVGKISDLKKLNNFYLKLFGKKGQFTLILKKLKNLNDDERPKVGRLANFLKKEIIDLLARRQNEINKLKLEEKIDVTAPGSLTPIGHLHLVTYAIEEITRIFERIGFTRVRYKEVEWEWYAFESLNMPESSPARDDIESFFIDTPPSTKFGRMVLSPHTSSGQVREMKRVGTPPIRMINLAKCYRPNWDISHTPMFHQFEGLVIDKGINITHLKGTLDYFVKEFYGSERKARIRPFHFQFTEPSFEVDISCAVCNGKGCRMCKQGWLELGGSGMVHPNVLKAGEVNPSLYTGFAFGWGVERCLAMKPGLKLDDNRIMYQNDIRFLEQF